MSHEDLLVADLALLAQASRERPIALDATLRCVVGQPVPLVALARVFEQRVARIASALALVTSMGALLVYLLVVHNLPPYARLYDDSGDRFFVFAVIAIAGGGHLVAARLAARAFRRGVTAARDPHAHARALVGACDTRAIVGAICGPMIFALGFGLIRSLNHGDEANLYWTWGHRGAASVMRVFVFGFTGVAITAGIVGAVVVARRAGRGRSSRLPTLVPAAIAIGLATLWLGGHVPMLDDLVDSDAATSTIAVRCLLVVMVGLALFVAIAGRALARRQGEETACTERGG